MPRKPRCSKRFCAEARDAVLAGKGAPKAMSMALGVSVATIREWLADNADFAGAVADAEAELAARKAAQINQPGRKTKYTPEMLDTARLHAATGKTDEDIAYELGVSITTLRNWRDSHPELHTAIQDGRDHWTVTTVEQSLIKRAQGYEYEETSVRESEKEGRCVTTTKKHMPPDSRAAQFVLTNRAPERWRDRQEIKHTGEVEVSMPDSVRDMLANILGKSGEADA